jgi:hypothetical protein
MDRQAARIGSTRLLFAAASLALIGCGGSDDSSTAVAPVPPAPSPAPSPTPPPPPPAPTPAPPPSPPAAPPPPAPIAVTPVGVPEGLPANATIGAAGGSLTSADGRLTITVPAGALAADTLVGIQPITPTAPGALGHGYRLTPEGQNFAQPITLTFKYSAAEASATVPNLLRVATQTAQGTWSLPQATHDAAQRTLSVATTHFSDWSNVGGLLLRPNDAVVKVNKELGLSVILCDEAPDPNPNSPPVMRECLNVRWGGLEIGGWSVNGTPGGNGSVGTVRGLGSGDYGARYRAPATVPSSNPVAVTARYEHPREGNVTLVSEVTIVEEIRAYSGAFFSHVTTSTSEVQFSANFAVFHVPDPTAEAQGQRRYSIATGSAVVRARIPDCDWATGTAFLDPNLTSLITTEGGTGPIANSYQLTFMAAPTMTFRCAGGVEITGPVVTTPVVGLTATCSPPQIRDGLDGFVDGWFCQLATDARMSANWTMRATR